MEYSRTEVERLKLVSELDRLANREKEKRLVKLFNLALFLSFWATFVLSIFEVSVPDFLHFSLTGIYVVYFVKIGISFLMVITKLLDKKTRIIKWLKAS